MEDNPFLKLAGILIPPDTAVSLPLGKVISAPNEENPDVPLKVYVGGTVQEREDLLKNAALDDLGFSAGDQLLLLPIEDAQRYIIICKVVSA